MDYNGHYPLDLSYDMDSNRLEVKVADDSKPWPRFVKNTVRQLDIRTGNGQHLAMERLGMMQGLSWTHAPYRGTADTMRALLGGEIDFASESSGWAPMVMAGKLRLRAVFTAKRAKRFPDAPTVRELGFDVVVDSPGGLIGPRGMDPVVVKVLADAFRAAAEEPQHLQFLDNMDQPLILLDGPAYRDEMARTLEEERELLRRLKLLPS